MGAGIDGANADRNCAALLAKAQAGDAKAKEALFATFYERWHQLARRRMKRERIDHTLQATALLNEALIPLLESNILARAKSTAFLHFAVSRGIEQALVKHARDRDRQKRGGERTRVPMDHVLDWFDRQSLDIQGIARELEELENLGPEIRRRCEMLRLKVYGGHTIDDIASLLEVSTSTVEKDLRAIKALLRVRLDGDRNKKR